MCFGRPFNLLAPQSANRHPIPLPIRCAFALSSVLGRDGWKLHMRPDEVEGRQRSSLRFGRVPCLPSGQDSKFRDQKKILHMHWLRGPRSRSAALSRTAPAGGQQQGLGSQRHLHVRFGHQTKLTNQRAPLPTGGGFLVRVPPYRLVFLIAEISFFLVLLSPYSVFASTSYLFSTSADFSDRVLQKISAC